MKIKSIAQAEFITGGLSHPDKLSCLAYSISARDCNVGSKLAKIPGTVCYNCYARKGFYYFPDVQAALDRRKRSLYLPQWVESMGILIRKQSPNYFRWHDSGDLQSMKHLTNIVQVTKNTPKCLHWLPTKEQELIRKYLSKSSFPDNLTVRVSALQIDRKPSLRLTGVGSMVIGKDSLLNADKKIVSCPSSLQQNSCGACRLCWDKKIPIIAYQEH